MHSAVILFQGSMAEYIPKGMLRTKITDVLSKNVGSYLEALDSKRDSDQSKTIKDSKTTKGSEKMKTHSQMPEEEKNGMTTELRSKRMTVRIKDIRDNTKALDSHRNGNEKKTIHRS